MYIITIYIIKVSNVLSLFKQEYEESFDYLLNRPVTEKSETHKQIKSLTKAREKIFTFLLHPGIPPDNNGSERAIRNIKVKLKVSGQFKTLQGAQDYASLGSIIDTSRKRGLNEFDSLLGVSSYVIFISKSNPEAILIVP